MGRRAPILILLQLQNDAWPLGVRVLTNRDRRNRPSQQARTRTAVR